MRQLLLSLACGLVLLLGATALPGAADARHAGGFHRGGGHAYGHAHVNRNVNVNRNVTRNVTSDVNRRYVHHNGRGAIGATVCGWLSRLPEQATSQAAPMSTIAGKVLAAAIGATATINAPTRKLVRLALRGAG